MTQIKQEKKWEPWMWDCFGNKVHPDRWEELSEITKKGLTDRYTLYLLSPKRKEMDYRDYLTWGSGEDDQE